MSDLFDAAAMYDEDYLHFFAAPGGATEFPGQGPTVPAAAFSGETAVELAWRLLDLRPNMRVLDLACGHGDLAHRLAARGCRVTGLDSSEVFLDRARADAAAAGVSVEYVAGDMRQIPWTAQFDRVINWSTAFGYFDDPTNHAVLRGIVEALRPGGRLAMDLDNLTSFLASYAPSRVVAARDDGDMLVDRYRLNALTGRLEAERTVLRGGRARRTYFVKRLFGFPELRDWLLTAGFTTVAGHGEDGQPLTADHRRMIVVAGKPAF
ncbi:2-polyprenyl-3-methyl-5-hydroxy-6-metoxy-1,4-benzoquinol methylase [Amycolatopsis bartoniae]|nr:class I SAM-dependent methyltransferase [Amycolatopsis bartoniae]MBB2940035.1 2-polyprenyl-3-methyl-5-hydroxy-6-metoxy-1,4-benzoquinol methylase [Amycolatopsis bartoniae]TVT10000.1 class I SAM-dependent methyltransferase [Amycolatopsis bartoniae]